MFLTIISIILLFFFIMWRIKTRKQSKKLDQFFVNVLASTRSHSYPEFNRYTNIMLIRDKSSIFGKIILWWTGKKYNHMALLTYDMIHETNPRTLAFYNLSNYNHTDVILPLKNLEIPCAKAVKFFDETQNNKYDKLMCILWPFRRLITSLSKNKNWICTERVCNFLRKHNEDIEDDWFNLDPEELAYELVKKYNPKLAKGCE